MEVDFFTRTGCAGANLHIRSCFATLNMRLQKGFRVVNTASTSPILNPLSPPGRQFIFGEFGNMKCNIRIQSVALKNNHIVNSQPSEVNGVLSDHVGYAPPVRAYPSLDCTSRSVFGTLLPTRVMPDGLFVGKGVPRQGLSCWLALLRAYLTTWVVLNSTTISCMTHCRPSIHSSIPRSSFLMQACFQTRKVKSDSRARSGFAGGDCGGCLGSVYGCFGANAVSTIMTPALVLTKSE